MRCITAAESDRACPWADNLYGSVHPPSMAVPTLCDDPTLKSFLHGPKDQALRLQGISGTKAPR